MYYFKVITRTGKLFFFYSYQMNESRRGQPYGNKHDKQLGQSDRIARLQHVQILQYVRYVHEPQDSQKPQTFLV